MLDYTIVITINEHVQPTILCAILRECARYGLQIRQTPTTKTDTSKYHATAHEARLVQHYQMQISSLVDLKFLLNV